MNRSYYILALILLAFIYLNGLQGNPVPSNKDYDYDSDFFRDLSVAASSRKSLKHTLEVNRTYTKNNQRDFTDQKGGKNFVEQTVTENSIYKENGNGQEILIDRIF